MLLVFNLCTKSLSQIPGNVHPVHLHGNKRLSDPDCGVPRKTQCMHGKNKPHRDRPQAPAPSSNWADCVNHCSTLCFAQRGLSLALGFTETCRLITEAGPWGLLLGNYYFCDHITFRNNFISKNQSVFNLFCLGFDRHVQKEVFTNEQITPTER